MYILAIETTGRSGSLAVLDDARVMTTLDLDPSLRSAQSLAPGISSILSQAGIQPTDVQLVAVAGGPGSFTGLRVGVTTAKLFAYAVGSAVLGVNSLEAIAWQTPADVQEMWAVMDAERQQLFAGHFSRDQQGQWRSKSETQLLDRAEWLDQLQAEQSVSGPALGPMLESVRSRAAVLDSSVWSPKAAAVGQIAWKNYQLGKRDDAFSLVPQYFRRSAAEERLLAKNAESRNS